jgi:YD repeat-containing protein
MNEADLMCDCDNRIVQTPDSSYIVSFRGFYGGGMSRKIYLKTHPQVQQKITTDNVVSEEQYRYNKYDLIRSKSIVINQTDTLRTNYIYPTENSAWYSSTLAVQNRLSPIIEQITYRTSSNTYPKEVEQIRTDYKYATSGNTLLVPNTIQSVRSGSNQWRTDLTYNLYDAKGNVLQQTGVNGVPITLLWGYNNQHLIAEIKNATYEQIKNALGGQTVVDRIANADTPSVDDAILINNLRSNSTLKDAFITTYTYKPLVGMQTMTDPRGVVIKYDYDSFGRLNKVTQADKVIETYNYNYKN